ncbi:hypothetical protein D3C81_941800 [compost metagenome]
MLAGVADRLRMLVGQRADQRMGDAFEARLGGRVGEHQRAHRVAIHGTVWAQAFRPEGFDQRRDGTSARGGDLMGEQVCIDDRGAARGEHVGHAGLAAADAAGQSDFQHVGMP